MKIIITSFNRLSNVSSEIIICCGRVVAWWLAHWPLVLEVMGSIPAAGKGKFRCPNMLSLVSFAEKCAVLRIGSLTGGPLCRESHPLCRLKNPTVVYMTTCRLSSCKTGVYNVPVHLFIILKRECSSIYRKKVLGTRSSVGINRNCLGQSKSGLGCM